MPERTGWSWIADLCFPREGDPCPPQHQGGTLGCQPMPKALWVTWWLRQPHTDSAHLTLLFGRLPQSRSAMVQKAPARYEYISNSMHSISRKFGLSHCWTIAMRRNLILWWLRTFCVQWQTKETPAVQLSVMELFYNSFYYVNDTVKNSHICLDGYGSLSLTGMDWN